MRMRTVARIVAAVVLSAGVLGAVGCSTHRARSVKQSGFLGDYTQLEKGGKDEALLRYVSPTADFAKYKKIQLEPVKVYDDVGKSKLGDISPENLQKLVDYLDATVREKLAADYAFVDAPGADVMRIRIAITGADGAIVPLDVVSSIVPIGVAASALQRGAVGQASGVGDVSIEFEALDSVTGERLAAVVDKRVGNKYTGKLDKFDRWRTAKDSFDFWAIRLQERLAEYRAR